MKKFVENIKDMLYDSVDVILVIAIFLVVGGTILWRLDVLFASDIEKDPLKQPMEMTDDTNNSLSKENSTDKSDDTQSDKEANDTPSDTHKKENSENSTDNTSTASKVITVNIPQGSLGPQIAEILVNKGLLGLNDKWTFLTKARELGLDTQLKAGTFKIRENSSMDTMIKIIARKI